MIWLILKWWLVLNFAGVALVVELACRRELARRRAPG